MNIDEAATKLERYLDSLPDQDTRNTYYGDRDYSIREVREEVAARTKLGLKLIEAFQEQQERREL